MNFFPSSMRLLLAGLCCLGISISACDNDFAELNTNPSTPDQLESPFLLNYVVNRAASSRYEQWRGNLIYTSQWSQLLSGSWAPDRYVTTNEDWLSAYWNTAYGDYMRNLQVIITQDPGTNVEAMATIMKVLIMQRITDMYGDIPYSEAFQGGVVPQPAYDTQEEIYAQFVTQLQGAVGQLAAGNGPDVGAFDALYGGDIDKWRKLGNSVLLRVGLRMSEVDPTTAESVVSSAISGGILSGMDDVAVIQFDGSMPDGVVASGIGEVFNDFGIGGGGFALSDELVMRLQAANDPRLPVIAEQYNSDGSVNTSVAPEDYLGKPNGADITSLFDFAMPDHNVMTAYDSPVIYYGLAEAEFSRAEAILRGWVSGDAEEAYENGVRAAVRQLSLYPRAAPITDEQIEALLDEDEVEWDEDNGMELINTQKWIGLLFDGFEAYANLRRTGIPDVSPGLQNGESNGTIPKRLRYPTSEGLTNGENYNVAVGRLSGGDVITAPLWWDVD